VKYIVLNGSPKGKRSNSLKYAKQFIKGIKEFDPTSDVKIFNLADIEYKTCSGCFSCWIGEISHGKWREKPSKCKFNDGFDELLETYMSADRVIFVSPIQFFNISSLLQKFIERTLPLGHRFYFNHGNNEQMVDSEIKMPLGKKLAVICTYSEHKDRMFDGIRNQMKFLNENFQEIFVPSSMLKFKSTEAKTFFNELEVIVSKAGYEFAKNGCLTIEITQEIKNAQLWRCNW
jgi:multimeric flavodoxin WrbA